MKRLIATAAMLLVPQQTDAPEEQEGLPLYFLTNLDAPRYHVIVIAIDNDNPGRNQWKE